jgi:hypothetical protein
MTLQQIKGLVQDKTRNRLKRQPRAGALLSLRPNSMDFFFCAKDLLFETKPPGARHGQAICHSWQGLLWRACSSQSSVKL